MTDAQTDDVTPAPEPEPELLHGAPVVIDARGQTVAFPARDGYRAFMQAMKAGGFVFCSDLCGVDYLAHPGRDVPAGVEPERFEVVVNLLSMEERRRVRVRVQVPEADPTVATMFPLWPGTEAMEREVWDMFGIAFDDHPDLTRILMPEDWEGHPLRKDYAIGRVPVQFKATTARPAAQP
ncbi:MAG: NADH-quinone oxidoreductase subunit C [Actinomycetota bacterium]|nr:NADH-quinone oxidoreductase subunit C [Actinomycetota bacterium]